MKEERSFILAFLQASMEATGTDASGLAKLAKVSPSTLTRFIGGQTKHLSSTTTLIKIAAVSRVPLFAELSASDFEWFSVIKRIPPAYENHALEILRGIAEARRPPEQEGQPPRGKSRIRRRG